jgi:hypothetical protein
MHSTPSRVRQTCMALVAVIVALLACGPTPAPTSTAEPTPTDGSSQSPQDPLFQTGFGTDDPLPLAPDLWMICSDDACSFDLVSGNVDYPIVETAPGTEYPNDAGSGMWLPPMILPSGNASELTFDLIYSTETNWDGMAVLITNDSGATWTTLEPDGGYPIASVFALGGSPGYSGLSTGWSSETFTIRGFEGETVVIMFFFASDSSINDDGVGIDNITVRGSLAAPGISISSPPIQIEPSFDPGSHAPQATTRVPTSCMANIGDSWVEVEQIPGGRSSFVKGADADRTWLFVLSPLGNFCWIPIGDAEPGLDPDRFPVIPGSLPPTGANPPPACRENLPQTTCEASGGVWIAGGAAAPHCDCP